MDSVMNLITQINQAGAQIWVEEGQVHCRVPKGALSSEQVSALRQLKDEIVEVLTRVSDAKITRSDSGVQKSPKVAPVTYLQEKVWRALGKGEISGAMFLASVALRLRGPLDIDALRRSLATVIRRHEALRTRIVEFYGNPTQQIDELGEYQLHVTNLDGVCFENAEKVARDAVSTFFGQPMHFAAGPLFCARVWRLAVNDHVLAIATHYIISDGASLVILLDELWAAYADLVSGRPCSLAKVSQQYADYAIWERSRDPGWLERNVEYWKARLARATPTHLPKDFSSGTQRFRIEQLQMTFGERVSNSIRSLAQSERTVPALVVLTLYAAVLSRWTNKRDFLLSSIVHGRNDSDYFNVIGCFADAVFLRIEMTGGETFIDLLEVVSKEFFAAVEHTACGNMTYVEPALHSAAEFNWLQLPWGPGEPAMIPVPQWERSAPRITVESFPNDYDIPDYEISSEKVTCSEILLRFSDTANGICANGEYRADLFAADTIQRFLNDLCAIAECATKWPRASLRAIHTWTRSH